MTPVNSKSIPAELTAEKRWIVWRYEQRPGEKKPTKVPYDPVTTRRADAGDPNSGTSLDAAVRACASGDRFAGVGFIMTGSGFVGVDLDNCVHDGRIEPWAINILAHLRSYSEISPSGRGLRIIVQAEVPSGRRQKKWDDREVLLRDRGYVTITGDRLSDYPFCVYERTGALAALHADLFPPADTHNAAPPGRSTLSDRDLIERIRASRQGIKFDLLWRGNVAGYESQSEADEALACILAFWTDRDPAAIDRLFRQSRLFATIERHSNPEDYLERTISRALDFTTETYQRPRKPAGDDDMVWTKAHSELKDDPRLLRLKRLLNISRPCALGHLQLLWWHAQEHASEDGDLSALDDEDFAEIADWQGDPAQFVEALITCGRGDKPGFLDADRKLVDWDDSLYRRREQNRESQRRFRERKSDAQPQLHSVTR